MNSSMPWKLFDSVTALAGLRSSASRSGYIVAARGLFHLAAVATLFVVFGCQCSGQTNNPAPSATAKIEVEVVTLRDGGFYPNKITRPAGQFVLLVINRSHAVEPQFGITNSAASAIAAVESVAGVYKGYILQLAADTYLLSDSSHPSWSKLTIVTH